MYQQQQYSIPTQKQLLSQQRIAYLIYPQNYQAQQNYYCDSPYQQQQQQSWQQYPAQQFHQYPYQQNIKRVKLIHKSRNHYLMNQENLQRPISTTPQPNNAEQQYQPHKTQRQTRKPKLVKVRNVSASDFAVKTSKLTSEIDQQPKISNDAPPQQANQLDVSNMSAASEEMSADQMKLATEQLTQHQQRINQFLGEQPADVDKLPQDPIGLNHSGSQVYLLQVNSPQVKQQKRPGLLLAVPSNTSSCADIINIPLNRKGTFVAKSGLHEAQRYDEQKMSSAENFPVYDVPQQSDTQRSGGAPQIRLSNDNRHIRNQ